MVKVGHQKSRCRPRHTSRETGTIPFTIQYRTPDSHLHIVRVPVSYELKVKEYTRGRIRGHVTLTLPEAAAERFGDKLGKFPSRTHFSFNQNNPGRKVRKTCHRGFGEALTAEKFNTCEPHHDQIGDDLISQDRSGSVAFYHNDGQMSVRQMTDALAAVLNEYTFDAFGVTLVENETVENLYKYAGEQFDPNVGFYYLRARYYNQATGRFNRLDPWRGSPWDPASLHKYLYGEQNPVNASDPSGKISLMNVLVTILIISILVTLKVEFALFLKGEDPEFKFIKDLTQDALNKEYDNLYSRLQKMPRWKGYVLVYEANFDTEFWTGPTEEKQWRYEGDVYTGNEVNYIGIGMFEAWRGRTLETAQRVTKQWKFIMHHAKPSEGTMKWLEEGYNEYKRREEE